MMERVPAGDLSMSRPILCAECDHVHNPFNGYATSTYVCSECDCKWPFRNLN